MKFNKMIALVPALFLANVAFAAEGGLMSGAGLGMGLVMGLAALGGTLGQSRAASAAYEAIGRNPQAADKLNTPFILGMAFIESLVLFAMVVVFAKF